MNKRFFIFSFIFAFLIESFAIAQSTVEPKENIKKIEVVGSAEMEITPDEIYVNFTLQEYYNKQKLKIDIDAIQKDFLDRCTKAGINKDRIQVQNMSGFDQSNWYWKKKKKEQPDMMAFTTYIIKFSNPADIDKLVNVLDDNATQSMSINRMTSSKMEEYRKEVKIKALQAAKAKAQYLCESIGEKLGNTLYIKEVEEENIVRPMYKMEMMSSNTSWANQASANEGIDFQKIKVRYTMQAQFAIQ